MARSAASAVNLAAGMLVVGAGECGARTAVPLREHGWTGSVTLVGASALGPTGALVWDVRVCRHLIARPDPDALRSPRTHPTSPRSPACPT